MSVALPEAIAHYSMELESFEMSRRQAPLDYYKGNGIGTDKLIEYINLVDEVWWVSGNSGGKTTNGANLCVAFALNRPALDGRRIPQFGWSNVGWVCVKTYKQQVDSSQKAYIEAVGEWPHDISWVDYGKGYIDTIYLAGANCSHGTGSHCLKCSRIVFRAEQGKAEIGGRIDWVHIDEPCSYRVLDELRGRRTSGRPFKRIGTATFLKRSDWEWFVRDFEGCFDTPRRDLNRAWYRTKMRDNIFLSPEDIEKFEADFARSDLREARLFGMFCDVENDNPLDIAAIQELMKGCVRGVDVLKIVRAQTMRAMRQVIAPVQCTTEVWWTPEDDTDYFGIIDPSQGIKSVRRDPGALHIYSVQEPRLCARYNGYVGAYGIGALAVQLGREYNDARFDIDMTGGYGTATAAVMQELGYSNFAYDIKRDRPGVTTAQLGFKIHSTNRGEIISDLQEFCANPDITVLSHEVFESLLALSIDDHGKIAAIEGSRHKDDDAVCLGRMRHHLKGPIGRMPKRVLEDDVLEGFEQTIARLHNRDLNLERAKKRQEVEPRDRFLDSH